jgi:Outer membrane protein beta-barrel domain
MAIRCLFPRLLTRRIALAASVLALTVAPCALKAQKISDTTDVNNASASSETYSSSLDWKSYLTTEDSIGSALPGSPSPSPQYGQSGHRYPESTSRWSHLALEAGAGFTAPIANTAHGWETYGYNIKAGAGWNFTKHFGALIEYQFNRDKIPGSTLAQLAIQSGSSVPFGGNVNTWSFTIDPIFYLPVTKTTGAYITGGGGFYRKVTNFTAPVFGYICYYYCYPGYYPTTIAHSSSNQGGVNIGAGFYWKAFGEDSNAKFFAEARYTWVDSPVASNSDPYGSGTSSLIPVTLGIRF